MMDSRKLIRQFVSKNETETTKVSLEFGKSLKKGDCVALIGNLGTGKTVFSKGICKALGYGGEVTSPTYSLVQEYPVFPPIIHLDLYRVPENPDWDEIGMDHYLNGEHICLVEWAEKMEGYFNDFSHLIEIKRISEEERELSIYSLEKNP